MDCLSYANNHTKFTERIPIPLQRLRIYEYCSKNNMKPRFEHAELFTFKHFPLLINLLETNPRTALLFFSIHSLPKREDLFKKVQYLSSKNRIELHFCNEDIIVKSEEDWDLVKEVLEFS